MERLDTLVAKVLADARRAMEKRAGEARSLPGKAAEAGGGGKAPRLARGDRHHRTSIMRRAKKTTTTSAKRETAAP